jgi:hypothetical protein
MQEPQLLGKKLVRDPLCPKPVNSLAQSRIGPGLHAGYLTTSLFSVSLFQVTHLYEKK